MGDTTSEVQATARSFADQYPGVRVWFGLHTRNWWAMVPMHDGLRLVEAPDPRQLREEIINATAWPWRQR